MLNENKITEDNNKSQTENKSNEKSLNVKAQRDNKADAASVKNNKIKKAMYSFLSIVFLGIALGCGGYLAKYYIEASKSQQRFDELANEIDGYVSVGKSEFNTVPKFIEVDGVMIQSKFQELYTKNKDFIGWIKIDDTKIDYPVMCGTPEDEEFYIHRNFYKEYDSAGTIFIDTMSDYQTPGSNILIYGHNMKSNAMFAMLLNYNNEDYYKEHKYIEFDTIYGNASYEILAAGYAKILNVDDTGFRYYNFFNATNEEEFADYISNVKALCPYDTGVEASLGDNLITLSTCDNATDNGRFIVVAKRIEASEPYVQQ